MILDTAVDAVWRALGGVTEQSVETPTRPVWSGTDRVLPARLPVGALARVTVAVCAMAAAELATARGRPVPAVPVDSGNVATAFVSERYLRVGGTGFDFFAPLSRFWRASDGWVRTHGNYPHHRARLLRVLGVEVDDAVPGAIERWRATDLEDAVAEAGGLAVALRTPEQWLAHPQGALVATRPLVSTRPAGAASGTLVAPPLPDGPLLPAAGIRVLDLTRVIAGPTGTRVLALLGADVLRVDPPVPAEIEAQHLDTGFGKRTVLLDLARAADRSRFSELLAGADVVVTGYRPGALDRFGLSPDALVDRCPGLVVARLSAWGSTGPWAHRRGFDSLVQVGTGIAAVEGTADGAPGALPAQALDHGTGYLLAAAVLRGLAGRVRGGGGVLAELSLAGTAHALLHGGLPGGAAGPDGGADPEPGDADPERWCTDTGAFHHALPPVRLPGAPATWAHPPHPLGSDAPAWL